MRKLCRTTSRNFEVSPLEGEIYQQLGLPLPKVSPEERARCRLAWRNERTLYRRPCDATGAQIVSIFDVGTPFPVYNLAHWWSDAWDPMEFGADFSFADAFFPQFLALFNRVPQCAIRAPQSENCDFTNQCEKNKDCYLIFCSNLSERCMYGMWYQACVDCMDCTYLERSELCYEVLNGKGCYQCGWSENLQNCSGCYFSRDLTGCNDCFGCVNLRNKSYYFFNQKLTKEAYFAELKALRLDRRSSITAASLRKTEFAAEFPVKYFNGHSIENSHGDYLENCKNVLEGYNCRHSENLVHCRDAWRGRNSCDLTETLEQDFCVQLEGCYLTSNSAFCAKISETHESMYSSHCFFSKNLFGCVGLKRKQYCILNKQYSKDDYGSLRKQIVEHMKATGEWGRYFPLQASPFAYNESVAIEYFPLRKDEALAEGLRWKETVQSSQPPRPFEPSDSIHDVDDSILAETLRCPVTGKAFKIQNSELAFYRKTGIPIPIFHSDARHAQRMAKRNARALSQRTCDRCKVELSTTYEEHSVSPLMCSKCFLDSVE